MIRNLHLKAFRRFADQRLPFAPLTLLTGLNSGGKSSVFQSLLLLRMEARSRADVDERLVPLNDPVLTLGNRNTAVSEITAGDSFWLSLKSEDASIDWSFGGHTSRADGLAVPCSSRETGPAEAVAALRRSLRDLRHVPADRLGPSETYPLDDPQRHESPGPRAQLAFGALIHESGEDLREPALRHPDELHFQQTFNKQVEAWLGTLFPGVVLAPRRVDYANLMTLGIRTNEAFEFHRPACVGFGITYVLPVVISLLLARKGDVVLIENPEAHLHPRAQSRIGRLCARAAAAGVQVCLESHSDHVLNGVRVAVHGGHLAPEDVSILYFGSSMTEATAHVQPIRVDRGGRLDPWPEGFFDESDHLLEQLLQPPERA